MKKAFLTAVFIMVVGGIAYFCWRQGWFSPGPEAVLEDSFRKANAGDYEGATNNLWKINRKILSKNPDLSKELWDRYTRNRNFVSISFSEDFDKRIYHDEEPITFTIRYRDGEWKKGREILYFEGGRWTHSFQPMVEAIEKIKAKNNPKLTSQLQNVPGIGVSMRFPEGCDFDDSGKILANPYLRIRFEPTHFAITDLLELLRKEGKKSNVRIKHEDALPGDPNGERWLIEREESRSGGKSSTFLTLLIGNHWRAISIEGEVPVDSPYYSVVREALLSAKWNPVDPAVLAEKLEYQVSPASPFVLHFVDPVEKTLGFRENIDRPTGPQSGKFLVTILPPLFVRKDPKEAFILYVERAPRFYDKSKSEKVGEFVIQGMKGFESFGTIRDRISDRTYFRYVASLFGNNKMYVFIGHSPLERKSDFEKTFQKMTRSFRFNK